LLHEGDDLGVRAVVVQRVARERELDLEVLRVLGDERVPLGCAGEFLRRREVAQHVPARRLQLGVREEAGHDGVAVLEKLVPV
jgi:hypothetical protein